jgi:hypothetical protein
MNKMLTQGEIKKLLSNIMSNIILIDKKKEQTIPNDELIKKIIEEIKRETK